MTHSFPKLRCLCFIVVLICLIFLQQIFKEKLLEKSYDLIPKVVDEDSAKFKFWRKFEEYTDDNFFSMIFLVLCAFLSRERFWYYILEV